METKQLYHIKPADNKSQLSEAALELVEYAAKTYGYCIADEEQLKEIESDIRQRAEKAPRGNMIAAPKVTSWIHPTNKTYFIGIDGWPLVCNRTRFVQIKTIISQKPKTKETNRDDAERCGIEEGESE